MLQNLHESNKNRTYMEQLSKYITRRNQQFGKPLERYYNNKQKHRFIKYEPNDLEYKENHITDFTGVYIFDTYYMSMNPFTEITCQTKSRCNQDSLIYGLCDNAAQVIELYDAIFNGKECNKECIKEYVEFFDWKRKLRQEFDAKYNRKTWIKGNHVIILHPVKRIDNLDFGWHKWGGYIGEYDLKHEYFGGETGIEMIYFFEIHKVR